LMSIDGLAVRPNQSMQAEHAGAARNRRRESARVNISIESVVSAARPEESENNESASLVDELTNDVGAANSSI
jgi:hypothetical protein